jgi:hypothetical protein
VILDDGELDDVREVLSDVGVPFATAESSLQEGLSSGASILFTTPRYAVALQSEHRKLLGEHRHFHVICCSDNSRTLNKLLKRMSFDFILRRPVHPNALRLLVEHALYDGPENRRGARFAIGKPVKVRVGWLSRNALLAQLSPRGCGLLIEKDLRIGDRVTVLFPPALTGTGALALAGRVVGFGKDALPEGRQISVAFDSPDKKARAVLHHVLEAHAVGTAPLPGASGVEKTASGSNRMERRSSVPEEEVETDPPLGGREKRASPRKAYREKILASNENEARALIVIDLSAGGMRIRRDPWLALGDEFTIVLYGPAHLSPLLLKTVVARDDGDRGWMLQFCDVNEARAAKLARLLDSLPDLDGEAGPGVVVSEIVGRG